MLLQSKYKYRGSRETRSRDCYGKLHQSSDGKKIIS